MMLCRALKETTENFLPIWYQMVIYENCERQVLESSTAKNVGYIRLTPSCVAEGARLS